MTRNLKTLGLALVAALALSAVVASAASAAPALFTANVAAGEQAEIHGEQEATDLFTISGLPSMTCVTATETGFPEEDIVHPKNPPPNEVTEDVHKKGPSAGSVTLTPTYHTCHIVLLFVTRTVTVTTNGCTYTFAATKNTPVGAPKPFTADLTINCPTKPIEIHVYNTSNHNDTGAATLCTYDVGQQGPFKDQIELTNIPEQKGPPVVPDNVTADINVLGIAVHNTILSGTCGNVTNTTATYKGSHTLRATNEAKEFVSTTVS